VVDATETLFLRRGNELAIDDQARCRVRMVRIEPEDDGHIERYA
jgi:hypothetical protein